MEGDGGAAGWTAPDGFGLAPTPYHGGVVLFKEQDGSIDAFASGAYGAGSMELRHQQNAGAGWGPRESMGQVPDAGVGLSQPSTVEQLPDGRLHVAAREWNRDRVWEIGQSAPGGNWGPWQLAPPSAAPPPRTATTPSQPEPARAVGRSGPSDAEQAVRPQASPAPAEVGRAITGGGPSVPPRVPPPESQNCPTIFRGVIRTTTRGASSTELGLNSRYFLPVYLTESSSMSSWPPSVVSWAVPRISAYV